MQRLLRLNATTEIIAIECDDNCDIFPIRDKKKMLAQLRDEINQLDGKLLVSEILTAVMTSAEGF